MQSVVGAICSPKEFDDNLKIDFSSFVKKKAGVDYVPYGEIIRTLHKAIAGCTYGFKETPEGSIVHYTPDNGAYLRPYLVRTYMRLSDGFPQVFLVVESPPGFFPVSNMAARHKALINPDIRNIDNCLRRAVAKEIAIHTGIGLQLWSAEDPYDLVEDESEWPATSASSKGASVSPNGSRGMRKSVEQPSAPAPSAASPEVQGSPLDAAAEASGLTDHGKATIAMAVKATSWGLIPDDKAPKIIAILASSDNVKLFNAGRNTAGKVINPKDPGEEMKEIAEALSSSVV